MKGVSWGLTIGVTVGVVIGVLLATSALFCIRFRKKRAQIGSSSSRRASTIPIRVSGVDACTILSDSTTGQESPKVLETLDGNGGSLWLEGSRRNNVVSVSGIPKYPYKDLQKATSNFTTVIGQGAFGPVYKAQMSTGETVAVKVLASNSKQGEKEFQTEVLLLGRLHHRNLVNLVGYCAEKGEHMLIYVYMTNGSLASHLYNEKFEPLKWDLRINIALDVARGLEYLHDGAVPPVVHRDIKSHNILLDKSMNARVVMLMHISLNEREMDKLRVMDIIEALQTALGCFCVVADFGLSREEMVSHHASNIRGTLGYLDPEYISSRSFTTKSDVYSFGVLLFELIAGRNPQQGLMEYVELAAINAEGNEGWEEIVDDRLDGSYDTDELHDMASLAYKCINRTSRKRPSMRDVVQALSRIVNGRNSKKRRSRQFFPVTIEDGGPQIAISDHHIQDSFDSLSDLPDV